VHFQGGNNEQQTIANNQGLSLTPNFGPVKWQREKNV